jgi:hypothetical protein
VLEHADVIHRMGYPASSILSAITNMATPAMLQDHRGDGVGRLGAEESTQKTVLRIYYRRNA